MAISLPINFLLPFTPHYQFNAIRSQKCFPTKFSGKKSLFGCPETKEGLATRTCTTARVLSRSSELMSSNINELEKKEKEEAAEERILADSWREIHGQDDWIGMLDPMDSLLRTELIRYGELAQACYDSFDFNPYSKYCGSCRYLCPDFFPSLGMSSHGYDVTRYLYATSNINLPNFFKKSSHPEVWSRNSNWIGYVAVSNDETSKKLGRRDMTIAWRGTVTELEWIADLTDFLKPISAEKIPCPDPTIKVESGFLELYTDRDENCRFCKFSAREQILSEVKRFMETYPNEDLSISITGHSLGGALALVCAYDIAETARVVMQDRTVPICVFSFAGPRVGNTQFKKRFEQLGIKVLRVVNVHDVVPKSPGFFFNERLSPLLMKLTEGLPWSYSHVGVELELDHTNSPFLKETFDPANAHNLEAYLHLLDGYHGKKKRFVQTTGRDPALVNKSSGFLKDQYLVSPNWWQDQNKGMIRGKNGRWMEPERPKLDDHPADMLRYLSQLGLVSDNK